MAELLETLILAMDLPLEYLKMFHIYNIKYQSVTSGLVKGDLEKKCRRKDIIAYFQVTIFARGR